MIDRIRWYEKSAGHTSAMRIIAMICSITGCIAVLAGAAGMFLRIPESVAIVTAGAGMAGLGEVSKAWQAGREQ